MSDPRTIPSKAAANGEEGGSSIPARTNRVYARRARLEEVEHELGDERVMRVEREGSAVAPPAGIDEGLVSEKAILRAFRRAIEAADAPLERIAAEIA